MENRKTLELGLRGLAALTVLGGCAAVPPEREERDRMIIAASKPCTEKYSYILLGPIQVNPNGGVSFWYNDQFGTSANELLTCVTDATKELRRGPYKPGELARPGPARVPVTAERGEVLAPVRVNGTLGTMAVDRSAAITTLTPAFAKRIGLNIVAESPTTYVTLGGKLVEIPYARVRALEVGDASVGTLDVAVYEVSSGRATVDGVLGRTFLDHFRMDVDPRNNELTLGPPRAIGARE